MNYIGIDPGKSGALAVIFEDGRKIAVPYDEEEYVNILHYLQGQMCCCCLERVGAMPGQGVVSMFNFGQNFGFIQGALRAMGIPFELVTPQRWKKEFGITRDKNLAIDVARRLFPEVDLRKTERSTKAHDGKAEALLMAEYARRKF